MAVALAFSELNIIETQRNLAAAGLERQAQPSGSSEVLILAPRQVTKSEWGKRVEVAKSRTTLEAVRSGESQKRELDAASNPPIIASMRVCEEAVLPCPRSVKPAQFRSPLGRVAKPPIKARSEPMTQDEHNPV